MRTIGFLLLVASGLGFLAATQAFGDIGLSFGFAAIVALLAGIGFLIAAGPVNAWIEASRKEAAAQFIPRKMI